MQIYPAIDLMDGRCVRLLKGDFSKATDYGDDPLAQAQAFADMGAEWIHIVDLDAAKTGKPSNRKIVAEIVAEMSALGLPSQVQFGGGVRSLEDVGELSDMGIDRAVVGTVAVRSPELFGQMARVMPLAAGLDVKNMKLAVEGWVSYSDKDLVSTANELHKLGAEALVVTDISQDGTMDGPNLEMLKYLMRDTFIEVIASGGVGSLSDLKDLADLRAELGGNQNKKKSMFRKNKPPWTRKVSGAIVGRALYEGAFSLEEALEAVG